MKRGLKVLGILATTICLGAGSQAVYANCQGEGPYPVIQCAGIAPGAPTWFDPPPGGGTVTPVWWQIGMGNATEVDASGGGDPSGGGFYFGGAAATARFIGNDSGSGNPALPLGLDLVDATPFGVGIPPGSLCFSSAANWGAVGIDGCCDRNVNYYGGGATGDVSDAQLNPYYGYFGSAYLNTLQFDLPLAILLKQQDQYGPEHVAVAFLANQGRGGDPYDPTAGSWDMNAIQNGLPNPLQGGVPNVVPWQPVPVPNVIVNDFSDPNNFLIDVEIVAMNLVGDLSVRPSQNGVPGTSLGFCSGSSLTPNAPVTGVGMLDQCELVRYILEESPQDGGGNCIGPWVPFATLNHQAGVDDPLPFPAPGNTLSVPHSVVENTCIRARTAFGKIPRQQFLAPVSKADRTAKQLLAQVAEYGDVGYECVSREIKVGDPLISERANINALERVGNKFELRFETTVETSTTGIDIVGIDKKGNRRVLQTVECTECNSGVGASYRVEISAKVWRSTNEVQVVLQPSGSGSNIVGAR